MGMAPLYVADVPAVVAVSRPLSHSCCMATNLEASPVSGCVVEWLLDNLPLSLRKRAFVPAMIHSTSAGCSGECKDVEVKFSFAKPAAAQARLSIAERCHLLEQREKVLEQRSQEVCSFPCYHPVVVLRVPIFPARALCRTIPRPRHPYTVVHAHNHSWPILATSSISCINFNVKSFPCGSGCHILVWTATQWRPSPPRTVRTLLIACSPYRVVIATCVFRRGPRAEPAKLCDEPEWISERGRRCVFLDCMLLCAV